MLFISGLTAEPKQQIECIVDDEISFVLNLEYYPLHTAWFFSVHSEYGNVVNRKLTTGWNVLDHYTFFPFGLYVESAYSLPAFFVENFEIEDIKLYTLTAEDIADYRAVIC